MKTGSSAAVIAIFIVFILQALKTFVFGVLSCLLLVFTTAGIPRFFGEFVIPVHQNKDIYYYFSAQQFLRFIVLSAILSLPLYIAHEESRRFRSVSFLVTLVISLCIAWSRQYFRFILVWTIFVVQLVLVAASMTMKADRNTASLIYGWFLLIFRVSLFVATIGAILSSLVFVFAFWDVENLVQYTGDETTKLFASQALVSVSLLPCDCDT